jgi:hypothetical protein
MFEFINLRMKQWNVTKFLLRHVAESCDVVYKSGGNLWRDSVLLVGRGRKSCLQSIKFVDFFGTEILRREDGNLVALCSVTIANA